MGELGNGTHFYRLRGTQGQNGGRWCQGRAASRFPDRGAERPPQCGRLNRGGRQRASPEVPRRFSRGAERKTGYLFPAIRIQKVEVGMGPGGGYVRSGNSSLSGLPQIRGFRRTSWLKNQSPPI